MELQSESAVKDKLLCRKYHNTSNRIIKWRYASNLQAAGLLGCYPQSEQIGGGRGIIFKEVGVPCKLTLRSTVLTAKGLTWFYETLSFVEPAAKVLLTHFQGFEECIRFLGCGLLVCCLEPQLVSFRGSCVMRKPIPEPVFIPHDVLVVSS